MGCVYTKKPYKIPIRSVCCDGNAGMSTTVSVAVDAQSIVTHVAVCRGKESKVEDVDSRG